MTVTTTRYFLFCYTSQPLLLVVDHSSHQPELVQYAKDVILFRLSPDTTRESQPLDTANLSLWSKIVKCLPQGDYWSSVLSSFEWGLDGNNDAW